MSNIFDISLDELVENDIKDILLDKTNKSNDNMRKLNRIMLCILISTMIFLIMLLLLLMIIIGEINKVNKTSNYYEYRGAMVICELNNEAVFISTPVADYEKIKAVYEAQGGKCYSRESASEVVNETQD